MVVGRAAQTARSGRSSEKDQAADKKGQGKNQSSMVLILLRGVSQEKDMRAPSSVLLLTCLMIRCKPWKPKSRGRLGL